MLQACIFDLDGVLTDTAKFHYLAWKEVAQKVKYALSEEQNELLKGVSRVESLNHILKWANVALSESEKEQLLTEKNEHYLALIEHMQPGDLFDGVLPLFESLKANKVKIALGSSSKNAQHILEKLEIVHWFDAISDGNNVKYSKPHPEVFLNAAQMMEVAPENCIVFEDAPAGIEAAYAANMSCIGIGGAEIALLAKHTFLNLKSLDYNKLNNLLASNKNYS